MRIAHHSGFGHRLVGHQGAFDFGRPEAVAAHVDDIVDAAGDPVVAVLVPTGPVPGEVVARVLGEVGLAEPLVIAMHGTGLTGPGGAQAEGTRDAVALQGSASGGVHDDGLHTEEGQGGRARLGGCDTRDGRDEDAAGLGLPPGVHDGAAPVPDDVVIPAPDFGVDGLAHRPQDPQGGALVLLDPAIASLGQGPEGRGGRVEDVHAQVVDDLPVAAGVRIQRRGLEDHRGGAVGQRAVDDVAVARDPADIRSAEVDVVRVVVEDHLVREGCVGEVAAGGVE